MKKWIQAARLRTLPLSISGILLGTLLAASRGAFDWGIFTLACLTTLLLQVLSNYANDYGDGVKGTDNHRTGEKRAVASGEISATQMKNAVKITAILSLISAIGLLAVAYIPNYWHWFALYFGLGIASIWAAIQYTVGKNAYGYKAMGDIFVFIFFGLVAVIGTYMLFVKDFHGDILLPASAIGFLSSAVLNLNNMRDIPQDKVAGKRTVPIILGFAKAKTYHAFLMLTPFVLATIYIFIQTEKSYINFTFLILLIPAIYLLKNVINTKENAQLDSELKKTAFLTLAFALLFGFGMLL